jgi:acyl-CoA synthetase (NDP forming)
MNFEIEQMLQKRIDVDFDRVFSPRSVAVIGASSDEKKEQRTGWVGRLQEFGYQGSIYPINPRAEQILGLKAYPSVMDVPGPVDYAISAVGAGLVPKALEECIAKSVKVLHIYTAGFSETGTEQGKRLQEEVERIVQTGDTRIIGPNCMGVYCPESRFTFSTSFSKETGTVGLVSQSGAAMLKLIPMANKRGIRFSKVVSFGNAIDLNSSDFLEYLAMDPKTQMIFCYIEGIADGRRFFNAVNTCMKTKPVIMLKGGMTEGGRGVVASHTASLAGSESVWNAFFIQTGVMSVYSFEEAVDQMVAVQMLGKMQGRAVGIVARGGGPGVTSTDMCERVGLHVPEFTPETKKELAKITPTDAGSSIRNPAEIGINRFGVSEHYGTALNLVASDPKIDVVITIMAIDSYVQYGVGDKEVQAAAKVLIDAASTLPKPLVVVVESGQTIESVIPTLKAQEVLSSAGIPVFSSMEAAVKAVGNLVRYNQTIVARSQISQSIGPVGSQPGCGLKL